MKTIAFAVLLFTASLCRSIAEDSEKGRWLLVDGTLPSGTRCIFRIDTVTRKTYYMEYLPLREGTVAVWSYIGEPLVTKEPKETVPKK